MNKKIKQKWITALRSGKYKQGRNSLVTENSDGTFSYCCLGVLCDVMGLKPSKLRESPLRRSFNGYFKYLPDTIVKKCGLTDSNPFVDSQTLSYHNDCGMSFERIA